MRRALPLVVLATVTATAGCGADDGLPATAGRRAETAEAASAPVAGCNWPMWGQSMERSFSYPCPTDISPATVDDLRRRWFFNTDDVVTATPAVVGDTVYVGDWTGRFYALRRDDGTPRWTFDTEVHENVYSGQIVSSAAVVDVEGTTIVFFGGGKTIYALDANDGSLLWRHELGTPGDTTEPTEIETSPVVVDGMVIVGWDVHNSDAGLPAGMLAVDAATGEERWTFRTESRPGGCGDVWGSPTVDVQRRLVFAGSGNCTSSPEGWGPYTEALFALDVDSGEPVWSYQPHEPNNDDFDFAGAPNLFEGADGRALVGLGNKDAVYYAVDRATGEAVWDRKVAEPGITERGSNFSTGGFIGPTAYADGVIVGGTAVGGAPFLHAIDATTGELRWQQPDAAATYAAAAEAGGVVFIGGNDFTLRALDLGTGEVLWSEEMTGVVAGGAAIVGNDVVAVAGIREPGLDAPSETSGVSLFSLDGEPVASTTSTTEAVATTTTVFDGPRECVDAPCPYPFDLIQPPAGTAPTGTLAVTLEPWSMRIETEGLGPPADWLAPGTAVAEAGANDYAVYISENDDNPQGGLLCVLDDAGDCVSEEIPRPGAAYNRITVLAVDDAGEFPSVQEGASRLVSTLAFDPPLTPVAG